MLPENGSLTFSTANGALAGQNGYGPALSVADPGAGPETLALSVQFGTLTFAFTAGLNFIGGSSNDSSSMTVSGTLAAINNALGMGLTYTPSTNFTGTTDLKLTDTDTSDSLSETVAYPLTVFTGITPVEMQTAYGVNEISFNGVAGNGGTGTTRQTIAVVDAFNDPDIVSDANTFSSAFGLPQFGAANGPTLTVVGETGSLPQNAPFGSWAGEESLDVEWAHAIAPEANIVVVEANSDQPADLYAAAGIASQYAQVVSMSFGFQESSNEGNNDATFTTPGVTFVASSGDDKPGAYPGLYPAFSPNVVAVGGTTLNNPATPTTVWDGTYAGETGWYDSGGGVSQDGETEPGYQTGVQNTGYRTIPDVSMDAGSSSSSFNDGGSDVPVVDSWDQASGGVGPWQLIGGTSLSAPMFAGLIAIADQGRDLQGLPSLDGASQVLPALYNAPADDFHQPTSVEGVGNNPDNSGNSAIAGYDLVTGLGSPNAALLVPELVGVGQGATATVANNQLSIEGTDPAVSVILSDVPGNSNLVQVKQEDGTILGTFDTSTFNSIDVALGAGTHTLVVDFSQGNPIPAGGLTVDGTGGSTQLELQGGSFTTVTYTVTGPGSGSVALDGSTISFANLDVQEPLLDSDVAANRVFTDSASGSTTVNLLDTGFAVQPFFEIDSGGTNEFLPIVFWNDTPDTSFALTLNLGPNTTTTSHVPTVAGSVTIDGSTGTNVFDVQAAAPQTAINAVGGQNTFNVGEPPASDGPENLLSGITGALTISGSGGLDTATFDDSGSTVIPVATLTNQLLTGLDMTGSIAYSDLDALKINLGNGINTLLVSSIPAGTAVTINSVGGHDTFDVGEPPAGGGPGNVLSGIAGALKINGTGLDTATFADSGSTANLSATLTNQLLTGLDMPGSIAFSNLGSLKIDLGSGNNALLVSSIAAKTLVTINGGAGTNTLTGPNISNAWQISGTDDGTLDGTVAYNNFQDLFGGTGSDQFEFQTGGSESDIDGGGGVNTLDDSQLAGPVTVNLANDMASGTTFANIENFIGSASTSDTLDGPDATWTISGANSGTVNGLTFWSFENLTGGTGPNHFIVLPGGSLSGELQGGSGSNTLDYSEYGSSVTVNLGNNTATNIGSIADIQNFVGGTAPNTFIGPNSPTEWTVSTANGGTVAGLSFTNFENLEGGTSDNNFAILTGGSLSGQIVGGGGYNTLDYGDYTGNVVVDLVLGDATAIAGGVSNIQTVFGGFGNSLIVGDAGALQLEGGTGHNILIADTGAASLIGGSGDNILIGDPTIYDANLTALTAIFAEWSRTNCSFPQRLADLTSYSKTSLNGYDLLTPFTVFASGASDALLDGAGLNWNILTVGQDSVTIAEGQSLTMTPTAVPPTSGTLSYAWNINGNGNYNQASGPDPTLTWSQLNALGINDGPETFQMRLRITNGHTTTTSNPSTLYVTPVPPTATLNNNGPVAQGSAATVSFSNQFDPSPVETAAGFLYSYDFLDNGTFEVANIKSAVSAVPASDLLTVGPHIVHARITEAKGGKYTDYYTTINVVASVPKVTVGTPIPTSVPGESVPLVIRVSDTSTTAQAASFSFQVSFGDGDTTTFAGTTPVLVTHTYTETGTYVVQVTATDEYGNVSVVATETIKVVPVAVEADPFHPGETALFVGGTSGNDTVSFAASGRNIAVTLNGVSEGTFRERLADRVWAGRDGCRARRLGTKEPDVLAREPHN